MRYRILHPSGEIKWLRIVGHAVLTVDDDVVEYVGTVIDITEQPKGGGAMRENEQRLRLIIETIPALVCSAKPNGDLFFASQQFLTDAGCSIEDLRPPNRLRFIHPDDVAETLSWLVTLRDGCRHETTHRLRRSDGHLQMVPSDSRDTTEMEAAKFLNGSD
jgi:PAS domain S-box-containing protein